MDLINLSGVISSIAASFAAIFSFLMVRLAKKQTDEQLRPQLVIYFREKRKLFRVGNIGKEAAMNIKIKIIKKLGLLAKVDLGEASIAVPPGKEHTIYFRLNSAGGIMNQEANEPTTHAIFRENKFQIQISYNDISGENMYITTYELGKTVKHISTNKTQINNVKNNVKKWINIAKRAIFN